MTEQFEDLEAQLDELFRELDEIAALAKLRKEHTYVEDMIKLLLPRRNGMRRLHVIDDLEKQRQELGLPIPKKFEQTVQSAYNQNCIDSAVFQRRLRQHPDLVAPFHSPGGKGSGKWAVNPELARDWLKRRKRDLQ